MPSVKLTKTYVDRLAPTGKQTIVWDTEVRGFGVLVSASTDAKSWVVQRRLLDGRTRRLTIGSTSTWPLDKARTEARDLLMKMSKGEDPAAERARAIASTLRGAFDRYLRSRKNLAPRTVELYRDCVERHLSDWLDRPLSKISPDEVERKHAALGKSAGPAAADNAMRAFRLVYNDALDRDPRLPANPVRRLKRGWFRPPARTRSVRADELAAFHAAVMELPSPIARDYIRLLLFTGLRRREAAALKWSEIDFAEKVIRLPRDRTKAKRPLALPMSDVVHDLLVARRAVGRDPADWVFPASSRSGHIEEPKFPLAMVAKATGIAVSAHDLRRTFVTVAESCDVSPMALKALVNHSLGNDVTSGYVQMSAERLREPAQRVADRLKTLCGIAAPSGENVRKLF